MSAAHPPSSYTRFILKKKLLFDENAQIEFSGTSFEFIYKLSRCLNRYKTQIAVHTHTHIFYRKRISRKSFSIQYVGIGCERRQQKQFYLIKVQFVDTYIHNTLFLREHGKYDINCFQFVFPKRKRSHSFRYMSYTYRNRESKCQSLCAITKRTTCYNFMLVPELFTLLFTSSCQFIGCERVLAFQWLFNKPKHTTLSTLSLSHTHPSIGY